MTDFTISNWSHLAVAETVEDFLRQDDDCAFCVAAHSGIRNRHLDTYLGISPEVSLPEKELAIRKQEQATTRTSASFLTRFHDATVLPGTNIVVSHGKRIQSDSFRALGHLLNEGFTDLKNGHFSGKTLEGEEITQRSILLGIHTNRNYFHWLLEAMPRLLLARQQGAIFSDTLVVVPKMTVWMREIFDFYGFGGCRILENTDKLYRFSDLTVPARGLGNIRTFTHHAVLPSLIGRTEDSGPGHKLFISRAKSASRRMTNEEEIFAIAEKMGYQMIFPEKHSFEEQVRIFSTASHVAGCLGAGLTNMIFCRPDAALVELAPEGRTGDATLFANMADLWQSRYACAVGSFSGAMERSIDRRDFMIRPQHAKDAMESVD